MAVIHELTLKRDFKGIPKGERIKIVTASESVSTDSSSIARALRMAGYCDDDFDGIWSSSYWDNQVVPGDANALANRLSQYSMRVSAPQSSSSSSSGSSKKSEGSKSSKKSSDDGEGFCVKLFFTIIPLLPVWWILKAIIGLVLWPFRVIFCSNCNYPCPSYNFSKW